MDWRFNEFPNVGAHALYVTCVEIMTIPMDPAVIGANLVDVILAAHSHIVPTDKLPEWINAVGLILSNLPESYWEGLHIRIAEALSSAPLSGWDLPLTPEQVFDFQEVGTIGPGISRIYKGLFKKNLLFQNWKCHAYSNGKLKGQLFPNP